MKKIITVTNQKGGIGKSTTAHAIGAGYSLSKKKTLLIDLDPQCNLTMATGVKPKLNETAYEIMINRMGVKDVIKNVKDNLSIIPASNKLSKIAIEMNKKGLEYILKEKLSDILNDYEYVIIDTPPSLGVLTINALVASNSVVVPAGADLFSLEAIKELSETIKVVKQNSNKSLVVEGILLTRYQSRSILTKELTELIQETAFVLKTKVFSARIREAVAIKEAQAMHEDIFSYAPKSNVANDYKEFFKELTGMNIEV